MVCKRLSVQGGACERKAMKRIGILSDTHGKLREDVLEILRGCDVILHAGDINTPKVLESLREIAPLYVVRGNADKEWAAELPEKLSEEIFGLRIFMVHNKKEIHQDVGEYDLVVYGHSHKYEERKEASCFYLNPGSCGPRRFSLPVTMAVVEVEDEGMFRVMKMEIAQDAAASAQGKSAKENGVEERALTEKTLRQILRDVDKGRDVTWIAEKYGVAKDTAEQICRMYLTHPGIGAAGVKEKMAMPKDR